MPILLKTFWQYYRETVVHCCIFGATINRILMFSGENDTTRIRKKLNIMNTKIIQFSGNYTRQGKEFFNSVTNTILIIAERKHTSPKKTPYFLLQKLPNNKRLYISSLYPVTDTEYHFDYHGVKYKIHLDKVNINVSKIEKKW